MDWPLIIERNRERLLAVLAPLFAVLGFDPRRAEMPRSLYRVLLINLRPAESAVRRLIIIAARGLLVKLRAARAFPGGLSIQKDAERTPAFCLIDPLKRFAAEGFEWAKQWEKVQVLPRISVPGFIDPVFADKIIPMADDPVDPAALRLRLRLRALKSALENLPREARRLARWRARGELARQTAPKPRRPSAPASPRATTGASARRSTAFSATAIILRLRLGEGRTRLEFFHAESSARGASLYDPQPRHNPRHIRRHLRLKPHHLARRRMRERQEPRMQRLPAERLDLRPQRLRQPVGFGAEGEAVILIADQRVADMGHMDADLVGAASFEAAFDKAGHGFAVLLLTKPLQHFKMRDGMAGVGLVFLDNGLPGPVLMRAAERGVDGSRNFRRSAPDQSDIGPLQMGGETMVGKSFGQSAVGLVVFGDDHDTGRILVEPVHNARPLHPAYAGERGRAMEQQRIDQRAGCVAIARMHDKPGRLVDDDDVPVLKQNVERNVLRLRIGGLRLGEGKDDPVPRLQLALGLGDRGPVDLSRPRLDQRLNAAARQVRAKLARQPLVEPFACGRPVRSQVYQIRSVFGIRGKIGQGKS
jgi:hypothetical protein